MLAQFRRANDQARNDGDGLRISELQARQDRVAVDFIAFADQFDDIAPEPIPHVHQPHHETAGRCRATAVAAFLGSWVVAYQLSGGAGGSAIVTAFWSLIAITAADAIAQLAVTGIRIRYFINNFTTLYAPLAATIAVGGTIILLGRIASPALADLLLGVVPVAWWSIEFALIMLAAVAAVGVRRFGTTGRLTQLHDQLTAELARVNRRIQQRTATIHALSQASRTAALVLMISLGSYGLAYTQTLGLDRSGSLADPREVEGALVDSLVTSAAGLGRIDLLFLAHRPLAAIAKPVTWVKHDASHFVFTPMVEAHRRRQATEMKRLLTQTLATVLPQPPCTSIGGYLVRLSFEAGPSLFITDGKDDCHRAVTVHREPADLFVVLAPAAGDPDDEMGTFETRRAAILRLAPRATVVPLAMIGDAVGQWVRAIERNRTTVRQAKAPF